MFSDLEMDYVNPIDLCHRLNMIIWPEMILHAVLTLFFLLSLQILPVLLNAPLVAYHVLRVQAGRHSIQPTDVFRELPYRKREAFVKLGLFLLSFFFYLFRMVASLLH